MNRRLRLPAAFGALALLALFVAPEAFGKANLVIVNNDGVNEGFNDPAPRAPVGGNPGTTLGAQRLIAFQFAASIWGCILDSDVNIRINAQFNPQSCTPTSGTLGSAGTTTVYRDFPNAPLAATWYASAHRDALEGNDANPAGNDINATFNSNLGTATCLTNSPWYYGLDNNPPAGHIDLVVVLLHEFGHGLGFLTLVSRTTGALSGGFMDAYAHHLYDNTAGLPWSAMTNAQRLASITNNGNLVWSGPSVTAGASSFLISETEFSITAPGSIAGTYFAPLAAFGPSMPNLSGPVEEVVDGTVPTSDACEPILNDLTGKIALLDRGTCTFAIKVLAAQSAGAVGVIVVNNSAATPIEMGGDGTGIVIPAVMVSQTDGNAIRAELGNGVVASFAPHPTNKAGADAGGRVKIYAPNPSVAGSSTSHFDTTPRPNVLMEPAINAGLPHGVDLTRNAFEDIGWPFNDAPVAACQDITVGGDSTIVCNATVLAAAVNNGSFDPDGDALTMTLDPAGPYTLGVNVVNFIVSDGCKADTCEVEITVDCPVPVRLAAFSVARAATGAVLSWEVAEATDHAGFRVYREVAGVRGELTNSLLSGRMRYEFADAEAPADGADYWLAELSRGGAVSWHGPVTLAPTAAAIPTFALGRAYPNPFRGETKIEFSLAAGQRAELTIHDTAGRLVRRLGGDLAGAGRHEMTWDGRSESGAPAPAGLYFLKLQAGSEVRHQKVLLSR
jgi:hypothetical protein